MAMLSVVLMVALTNDLAALSSVPLMSAVAVFIDEGVMSLVTRPLHHRPYRLRSSPHPSV
jgi:hypothetical protein